MSNSQPAKHNASAQQFKVHQPAKHSASAQQLKVHQSAKHNASAQQFKVQTCKIVNQTFYVLLSYEGVILNESRRAKRHTEKDAVCDAFIGACKRILSMHRDQLRTELNQLDVSPSALCASYHQLANGLFEGGCNWGKVVMLFTASSLIAARLYLDGHVELIESIKEWLIEFIRSRCKDWVLQHDGWDKFPDTFSCYKRQTDDATLLRVVKRPRWSAAAVLRVSAAVGLGLSILGSINNPM